MGRWHTGGTAGIANRQLREGSDLQSQAPRGGEAEETYWKATVHASYTQLEAARERVVALLPHLQPRLADKKRTEMGVELVASREEEGQCPQAHYAFDKGVLPLALTRRIESKGNHGVSELESSRHMQWYGQGRRSDEGAAELRRAQPESFRMVRVRCRTGEQKPFGVFTNTVRLNR